MSSSASIQSLHQHLEAIDEKEIMFPGLKLTAALLLAANSLVWADEPPAAILTVDIENIVVYQLSPLVQPGRS